MDRFTVEEVNLMCIYETRDRETLLSEIRESLPYVDDTEMLYIMQTAIIKLENMTDGEFANIGLFPVFDFEGTED
jgi:hypothetical protein